SCKLTAARPPEPESREARRERERRPSPTRRAAPPPRWESPTQGPTGEGSPQPQMSTPSPPRIKFCSWNVQGLRGKIKQRKVLSLLHREKVDVALLQETHLNDNEHLKLKHGWITQVYFSSFTTSSRGVVILMNRSFPFQIETCIKDTYGRYVFIKGVLQGEEITIMNLYCPPNYSPDFLTKTFSQFSELSSTISLVGGDFNCLLNPLVDRYPSRSSPPTNQARALSAICDEICLADVWRTLHPTNKEFTFYSPPHQCHTRIDYFLFQKFRCNKSLLVKLEIFWLVIMQCCI
uniref:exodeoxyribonuclease III n=1 Tax=Oryzias latipes TaxID=8090 RepID=A0A3P9IGB8_ORYLA